jgi:hypothetical protein
MRNKNNTNTNQTASIKTWLLVFTIALVAFAAGFYMAVAHIAAMLTN